jgi:hypothetical protein
MKKKIARITLAKETLCTLTGFHAVGGAATLPKACTGACSLTGCTGCCATGGGGGVSDPPTGCGNTACLGGC